MGFFSKSSSNSASSNTTNVKNQSVYTSEGSTSIVGDSITLTEIDGGSIDALRETTLAALNAGGEALAFAERVSQNALAEVAQAVDSDAEQVATRSLYVNAAVIAAVLLTAISAFSGKGAKR